MLVPKFELTQTESLVIVTIYAPYANIKDSEVYVDQDDFRFYSKPYYLRLKLPGEVQDMGPEASAKYEAVSGKFIIQVEKVIHGQHFPNLDLVSTLLVTNEKKVKDSPLITVLDSKEENTDGDNSEEDRIFEEIMAEFDLLEQTSDLEAVVPEDSPEMLAKAKYGFGDRFSDAFRGFTYEVIELLDLPEPDITSACDRTKLRIERENYDFSRDHYLADVVFPEELFTAAMAYVTPWHEKKLQETLTTEEFDKIKELHSFEGVKDKRQFIFFGLVDILLAYCYDFRTNCGETTCESGWTINKLSSTLCWCEKFKNIKDILIAFMRRSLCYPLYRNWDLSVQVIKDMVELLRCGKLQVQKVLLQINFILNASEPRYLLNKIYINDYILWIAHVETEELLNMAGDIEKTEIAKEDVEFDLIHIDSVLKVILEHHSTEEITEMMNDLLVAESGKNGILDSDDDEEEDSDDDDDDDDGEDDDDEEDEEDDDEDDDEEEEEEEDDGSDNEKVDEENNTNGGNKNKGKKDKINEIFDLEEENAALKTGTDNETSKVGLKKSEVKEHNCEVNIDIKENGVVKLNAEGKRNEFEGEEDSDDYDKDNDGDEGVVEEDRDEGLVEEAHDEDNDNKEIEILSQ